MTNFLGAAIALLCEESQCRPTSSADRGVGGLSGADE